MRISLHFCAFLCFLLARANLQRGKEMVVFLNQYKLRISLYFCAFLCFLTQGQIFQRGKGIASPVVFSHRLGRFTGRLGEGTKMKCLQQKISISRVVEREDEIWNDNNNNNCHSSGVIHQKTGKITKPENTNAMLLALRWAIWLKMCKYVFWRSNETPN